LLKNLNFHRYIKNIFSLDDSIYRLFDMIPVGISVLADISCNEIRHNFKAAEFLRIEPRNILSQSAAQLPALRILRDGRELSPTQMPMQRAALQGEEVEGEELEFIWGDGVRKFAVCSACLIRDAAGDVIGSVGISEDITERKRLENELLEHRNNLGRPVVEQTGELESSLRELQQKQEQELRDSEEKYRFLTSSMDEGLQICQIIWGDNGQAVDYILLEVNRGYEQQTGLSCDQVEGRRIREILPDAEPVWLQRYSEVVSSGRPIRFEEYNVSTNRWYDVYVYSMLQDGKFGAVFRDITDRKRTEDSLQQSKEQFLSIFNASPAMIVIIRMKDNKYVEVNQRFLDAIGFTRDEVIGYTALELGIWGKDVSLAEALVKKVEETGKYSNIEFTMTTRSGGKISALTSHVLINYGGELCRLGTMLDMTKEKLLEAELMRLERLNLVGEMAASLGHEVRNPMTTVRGYLQMFQRKEKLADYHEQITTMIEELDRANSIIGEFLSLAKDKRIVLRPTFFNAVIRKLLPLLQADATREGKEVVAIFENVPKVMADENEIRQCILNLTRNALDAVGAGGLVTVSTDWDGQDTICLAVKDNGTGIPPKVLVNLGKPFITTKENGTGLGIPVCYRIAERHNAKMEVETGPNGTTIFVKFKVENNKL